MTAVPLEFAGLSPGTRVAGHALVAASAAALARTGEPYLRLRLADPAGRQLPARRFACPDPPPPVGAVVAVRGIAEEFAGALCLRLAACEVDPATPAAIFLPRTPATRAASGADLDALVTTIADPALRRLVGACLPPADRDRFLVAPASVARHGAAVGGLAAHSVRVARSALALAGALAPEADRDVLVAAALLHDIGKLEANLPEPGAGPTDAGRLAGHVLLGALRVACAAGTVPEPNRARAEAVLHAVAAAHGRPEWGAPVVPATIEALLVHIADLAEARVEAALAAVERAPAGAAWTERVPELGGALRVPRDASRGLPGDDRGTTSPGVGAR